MHDAFHVAYNGRFHQLFIVMRRSLWQAALRIGLCSSVHVYTGRKVWERPKFNVKVACSACVVTCVVLGLHVNTCNWRTSFEFKSSKVQVTRQHNAYTRNVTLSSKIPFGCYGTFRGRANLKLGEVGLHGTRSVPNDEHSKSEGQSSRLRGHAIALRLRVPSKLINQE